MKPSTIRLSCVIWGFLAASAQAALAEFESNPYQAIVARNPFGLKEPPPPAPPPPPVSTTLPGKVVLTGITTIFGNSRALLEVTEQEVGKTPTTRRPILHEGDRDGGVEVLSIDVENSLVRIRFAGAETNITFETPKMSQSAPAPMAAGGFTPPPAAAAPAAFAQPTTATTYGGGGGGGVTVFGNSGSGLTSSQHGGAYGTGGTTPALGGYGSVGAQALGGYGSSGTPSYGGGYGAPASSVLGAATTDNIGLRTIPSRTLRTDTPNPSESAPPADPAKQYLNLMLQHQVHESTGRPFPPLPPMPKN